MTADVTVRGAIAWLVAALVAAHVLAPESYSFVSNSLSELAAQRYEHAWVTRTGFIGFGVLLAWHYSGDLVHVRRVWSQAALLLAYGSCVALTGVFSTAPFEGGVAFSEPESFLHSIFATMAGACLAGAILVAAWRAPTPKGRWRHVGTLVFVTLASVLFAALPEYQGLTQRALWAGGLWWLGWASG
jgi:hypothetical membrane protein